MRDKRQTLTGYFFIDVAVTQTKSVAQVLALWHELYDRAKDFQMVMQRAYPSIKDPSRSQP